MLITAVSSSDIFVKGVSMAKNKKAKELKIKLTRDFTKGDKVVYSNFGRFKLSKSGSHKLLIGNGDKTLKLLANQV